MRILKLPAKTLYYVSDEFDKICKNAFLYVSLQFAARISTGKSDMAIAHCWIWSPADPGQGSGWGPAGSPRKLLHFNYFQ